MAADSCKKGNECKKIKYIEKKTGISAPPTLIAMRVLSLDMGTLERNKRGKGNSGRVMSVVDLMLNKGKLIRLPIKVLPSKSMAESGDNPSLANTIPNTPSCKTMMSKIDNRTKKIKGIIYSIVFIVSDKR